MSIYDRANGGASTFKRGALEFPENAEINVESLVKYGSLRNFENTAEGRKSAYRFGSYLCAVVNSDPRIPPHIRANTDFAEQRCRSLGIPLRWKNWGDEDGVHIKTSTDKNNTSSGFLVPEEFENGLIDLRERYGVFRKNARLVPMSSDSRTDPRRRGGLQPYFVDEGVAPSLTDKTWDRVKLNARKLAVLTKYSSELNEDAVLNIADDLAGEIAWAFALQEDKCGFVGDGTSTYSGMVGVINALKQVSSTPTSTITDVAGIWQSAATSWSAITMTDFTTLVSLLPEYADGPGAKWYCHRAFWAQVMMRLEANAGGNRIRDIQQGGLEKFFLGYPVVTSQVLPKTYVANGMPCLFGDLSKSSSFGSRRDTTIALSDQFAFDQDAIVLRGTERFSCLTHDCGENNNQTARDSQMGVIAGPIVGLMTT